MKDVILKEVICFRMLLVNRMAIRRIHTL